MSAAKWILNLWPGLPQLWWRGTWQSLSMAVAFTALFNSALLTSLWGGISWSPWLVVALWVGVCMFSLGTCMARVFDQSDNISRERQRRQEVLFGNAQQAYLKGHWHEAEKHVRELLSSESDDVEARLLLISIFRRSHRLKEAARHLNRLGKSVHAFAWHVEIEQELEKVNQALSEQPQEQSKEQTIAADSDSEPTTLAFPKEAA